MGKLFLIGEIIKYAGEYDKEKSSLCDSDHLSHISM